MLEAGGSLDAPLPTELYVIVPAADVPPPNSPFKCAHVARFSSFVEAAGIPRHRAIALLRLMSSYFRLLGVA